jgi:predicted phosphodiesterase
VPGAVAVLNDIHGNLPALEAVLDEIRRGGIDRSIDRIVVGGDVFPGPLSHVVLRTLVTCGVPVDFIYGNGEVAVLAEIAGRAPRVPEAYRPAVRWNAEQLEPEDVRAIAEWPMTLRLSVPPLGDVLFCHATPRNENEIFTKRTPEGALLSVFAGVREAVVVCGHTHLVMDRLVGPTRVVNPGSVGMPFGTAGADWLILGPGVEFRHTNYDLQRAADRVRASGYPMAEEFATRYILQPPSEEDMLKVYEGAEIRS